MKITESDRERAAKICQDLDAFIERCRVEGTWPPKGREGEEYLKLCIEQAFAEIRAEAQTQVVMPSFKEVHQVLLSQNPIETRSEYGEGFASGVGECFALISGRLKVKQHKPLPESVKEALKGDCFCTGDFEGPCDPCQARADLESWERSDG